MTKAKHLEVTQSRRALSLKQACTGENTASFSILFTHGSLVVEVYQPVTADHQKPHDRDECYVIIKGHGNFEMGDEIVSFGPGDFLFVPAGLPHRFTDFGDTMSTWVMFYGPDGGQTAHSTEKSS
ncbi:cupin domain-containing protein [Alphaproteobacteria bacterium]|nr:cupin domain-containing protein [Alphaproteobacteria bacterium]